MTIGEIQSTLDSLQKRHPNLTEELVSVLLEAGGWDKKQIEEAKAVFRSQTEVLAFPHEDVVSLPQPTELFIETPHVQETESMLEEGDVHLSVPISSEPESLIQTAPPSLAPAASLPDNLPLRPFESSPHAWSFARYKDVFHGDAEPVVNFPEEEKNVVSQKEEAPRDIQQVVSPVVHAEVPATETIPETEVVKVPLSKKDEGLIAFGAALLLALVLLILYMYNNQRL